MTSLQSAEMPVTNTATTPSAKRPAAAPQSAAPKRVKRTQQAGEDAEIDHKSIDDTEALQPAAPKREKRTQQAGESEAVGNKSTDNTQDMMSSMLSRLFVADRVQLSTSTITCLDA